MVGTVDSVTPGDGTVVSRVKTKQGVFDVPANYVIDCTGLEADITEHRVLADLLEHSGAVRNAKGKLQVETPLRGPGHPQRRRQDVRLRLGHARLLLRRGRLLPRPAVRRPCASSTTWPTRASSPASASADPSPSGAAGSRRPPPEERGAPCYPRSTAASRPASSWSGVVGVDLDAHHHPVRPPVRRRRPDARARRLPGHLRDPRPSSWSSGSAGSSSTRSSCSSAGRRTGRRCSAT